MRKVLERVVEFYGMLNAWLIEVVEHDDGSTIDVMMMPLVVNP